MAGKSKRHNADNPCSRSALEADNARVPAPPVITALPSIANRAAALSDGTWEDNWGSGAVSGLLAVDKSIVGKVREASAALVSSFG